MADNNALVFYNRFWTSTMPENEIPPVIRGDIYFVTDYSTPQLAKSPE